MDTQPDSNRSKLAQQEPDTSGGRYDVGQTMQGFQAGHLEEAERMYQLGNALAAQGRIDQAVVYYQRALSFNPDHAEVHNNLGNALAAQGRLDQAAAHYERALSLRPEFAQAHINLGRMLTAQGKINQTVVLLEHALSLWPEYAEVHNCLGNALSAQGQTDRAVSHLERALALKPDYVAAHINLGSALVLQGRIDQAAVHYERALLLNPDDAAVHSSLLYVLHYASGKDPVAVYAAHRDYARRWEAPLAASIKPHTNDRSPDRRLRIGYVSSDFRRHSVGYFIEPVLARHDHVRFEIFCYANSHRKDEVTERLRLHADQWRQIIGLPDEQVVNQIRADQIDILVDLNGHTGHTRLLAFARKPAPIQVTWLGYPNTTGLTTMDYRLTDGFADPVGMSEHLHSEKLIRLPECFSCYQPPPDAPEVSELPARAKGYVTFGSFNNLAKITPEVMAVWAKILQAVPDSRLILKNPGLGGKTAQEKVRETFTELGIKPERLELLGRDRSQRDHLGRYHGVDIALDTFPYNGTTTTCEALWMGVPVVVLAGITHAGRVGVSQLSNLGLTELIGHTPEEYIDIAVRWAADVGCLSALRQELRARLAASPLTDGPRFTKHLEHAYRGMWEGWCQSTGNLETRG